MLQFEKILNANKKMLLLSTSLVVAGCGTTADTSYDSTASTSSSVAAETHMDETGEFTAGRMMRMGDRAWARRDPETALRFYSMASAKNPKDPAPTIAIAEVMRKTKRMDAAKDIYRQLVSKFPKNVEVHSGLGYTLLTEDKPYLAAKSFEYAVSLDKTNARALGGLALAMDTAGEHDKAQEYYRLAVKAEPNNLTYQNNMALSLALVGRTDQAIAMFEIITAHPKATARHRQNLALVYGMAGKSAEALRYSRMDLSENEARNNALYFQALNGNADDASAAASEQQARSAAKIAKAERPRDPSTSRQPYTLIEARQDSVAIRTAPDAAEVVPTALASAARMANLERLEHTSHPLHSVIAARTETQNLPINSVAKESMPDATMLTAQNPVPAYRSSMTYAVAPREVHEVMASATPQVVDNIPAQAKADAPLPQQAASIADLGKTADLSVVTTRTDEKDDYVDPMELATAIAYSSQADIVAMEPSGTLEGQTIALADTPLYFIQVASFQSLEKAQAAWSQLSRKHSDLLNTFKPIYTVADLGEEKGTFYRVRIGGFAGKSTPGEICAALKERNADCYLPLVSEQIEITGEMLADQNIKHDSITAETPPTKKRNSYNGESTAFISY